MESLNRTLGTTRGPDGSGYDETEFLVFRDNRAHFVARKETICDDLRQPRLGFIQLLEHYSEFVNELRSTFCCPSLCVVWGCGKAGAHKLLADIASFFGSWEHLGYSRRACPKVN